ncbi:hypothetical protein EJ02DRAFT_426464 [Clathrospora elynae]|uniref:Uncharacterized protein n=1 Tax=Clathrospora elynae TaxID=706981 RepID=A0A6A5SD98_9PLEO|nr:hypothetical protein EJ02DRAFT_426464 [Clathrospora elynae]
MFKPLSSSYSKALTTHLAQGQGLVPIQKGDFFPLFWEAWHASFKNELVLKSFEATRIWPMERDVILKRFNNEASGEAQTGPSALSEGDWRHMERLAVKQQEEHNLQLQKADNKALKQAAKLYKEKIAEEKRVAREVAKKERQCKLAKKLGKRKPSQASSSKTKRQKHVGGAVDCAASAEDVQAAPPKLNSCGRPIRLLHKYNK